MKAYIHESDQFNPLFDQATLEQLVQMLRRRGIFVGPDMAKEELRPLFAMGFSYDEFQYLKSLGYGTTH